MTRNYNIQDVPAKNAFKCSFALDRWRKGEPWNPRQMRIGYWQAFRFRVSSHSLWFRLESVGQWVRVIVSWFIFLKLVVCHTDFGLNLAFSPSHGQDKYSAGRTWALFCHSQVQHLFLHWSQLEIETEDADGCHHVSWRRMTAWMRTTQHNLE